MFVPAAAHSACILCPVPGLLNPAHLPVCPPQPGRITLLLGTPGSGRSVLMKALSGRLRSEKQLKVRGDAAPAVMPC